MIFTINMSLENNNGLYNSFQLNELLLNSMRLYLESRYQMPELRQEELLEIFKFISILTKFQVYQKDIYIKVYFLVNNSNS